LGGVVAGGFPDWDDEKGDWLHNHIGAQMPELLSVVVPVPFFIAAATVDLSGECRTAES